MDFKQTESGFVRATAAVILATKKPALPDN